MASGTGRNPPAHSRSGRGSHTVSKSSRAAARKEQTEKTTFYLNGKKTSLKSLADLLGEDRIRKYIEEARETFFEDPLTENSFWIGNGMLTIEFN